MGETMKEAHGEEGHCNIYVRDHDDVITGYGKHDRVICFQPSFCDAVKCTAVYCRVDHKWGLGMPTTNQVLKVMKKDQCIPGRWIKSLEVPWENNNSTEIYFVRRVKL